MATATMSGIDQIGETAGIVWHMLDENGPMSFNKLVKSMDVPRDVVMQAIGWHEPGVREEAVVSQHLEVPPALAGACLGIQEAGDAAARTGARFGHDPRVAAAAQNHDRVPRRHAFIARLLRDSRRLASG